MPLETVTLIPEPSPYQYLIRYGPLFGVYDTERKSLIRTAVFETEQQARLLTSGGAAPPVFDEKQCSRFWVAIVTHNPKLAPLNEMRVEIVIDESECRYQIHERLFNEPTC